MKLYNVNLFRGAKLNISSKQVSVKGGGKTKSTAKAATLQNQRIRRRRKGDQKRETRNRTGEFSTRGNEWDM